MRFSGKAEAAAEGLPEPGEYVGIVREAGERPAPWDRENDYLALSVEVVGPGGVAVVEDWTGLDNEARLATICRSCGVDPVGDVEPSDLVGRRVGVEVRRKVAKSGREYAAVGRWFLAPPAKVETRPARLNVPKPEHGGGADDVPF
jgi:hypothetical protein